MSDFALDIEKFADGFIGGAEKAVRGTVIKLSSALIDSSPVDTGRFRANWFVAGATPSDSVASIADKSGTGTKARNTQQTLAIADYRQFTITNNLPYSEVIEFGKYGDGPNTAGGYSKQAPQGVLRQNVKRFQKLLDEEAKKALPK